MHVKWGERPRTMSAVRNRSSGAAARRQALIGPAKACCTRKKLFFGACQHQLASCVGKCVNFKWDSSKIVPAAKTSVDNTSSCCDALRTCCFSRTRIWKNNLLIHSSSLSKETSLSRVAVKLSGMCSLVVTVEQWGEVAQGWSVVINLSDPTPNLLNATVWYCFQSQLRQTNYVEKNTEIQYRKYNLVDSDPFYIYVTSFKSLWYNYGLAVICHLSSFAFFRMWQSVGLELDF